MTVGIMQPGNLHRYFEMRFTPFEQSLPHLPQLPLPLPLPSYPQRPGLCHARMRRQLATWSRVLCEAVKIRANLLIMSTAYHIIFYLQLPVAISDTFKGVEQWWGVVGCSVSRVESVVSVSERLIRDKTLTAQIVNDLFRNYRNQTEETRHLLYL